jgi:hypothetical protein
MFRIFVVCAAMLLLPGCVATKVAKTAVAVPVKVAWAGGKMAGKGVYHAGKGVLNLAHDNYEVAGAPVGFTDAAQTQESDFLMLRAEFIDHDGRTRVLERKVPAESLEAELAALERKLDGAPMVAEIVSITVDVA